MTKLMKLMPAALGVLALTGCNSDDVIGISHEMDLSGRTVLAVTNGDATQTRSFRGTGVVDVYYDTNDRLRVYDSRLQKYDEFVFSGSVKSESSFFVLEDEEHLNITEMNSQGKIDYAYALYGADDNLVSYAGWNDGHITALVKIKDEFDYSETKTADVDGKVIYKDAIPTFGVISESYNDEVVNDKAAFKTSLNMLTAIARVTFENGAQSGARYVRVTSKKFADDKTAADFEALGNKAQETTKLGTDVFAASGAKPLAGWFEASLTDKPATEPYGLYEIAEGGANADAVNRAAETSITVKVSETAMDAYTNIVYFPIVLADYSDGILLYEYSTDGSDWKYIGYFSGEAKRNGAAGNFTIATQKSYDGITIPGADNGTDKGLQTVIEEAVALNKPVVVEVNATSQSAIKVGDYTSKDNYVVLELPKLDNDITLNIYGNIEGENNTLTIKEAAGVTEAGEGTLTINYIGKDAAVKPNIVLNTKANIAFSSNLSGNGYNGNLTVTNVGDLTLAGNFFKDNQTPLPSVTIKNVNNLTLNGKFGGPVDVDEAAALTGDISVSGNFYQPLKLKTAGNISVDGTAIILGHSVFTAANISIKSNLTTGSDVTTNGVVTVDADVTVDNLILNTGSATISGKVTNLTTNEAPVTINGEVTNITTNGAEVTIDASDKTITTLVLGAPATINLKNGIINTISKTYNYDKAGTNDAIKEVAKVNSEGRSYINKVEGVGNWINFSSKWDGVLLQTDPKAQSYDGNVYTAAQFYIMCKLITLQKITLYTDIDFDNKPMQHIAGLYKGLEGVVRDNGTTATLKNLKLTNNEYYSEPNNFGLFQTTYTNYDVIVKNLVIENVEASFTDNVTKVTNAGVLFGNVKSDVTIENVIVKDASLKCSDQSYNIGGLIGYVETGTVKIESTTVKAEIEGYYNLGGIIGSVAENAIVTLGKTKNVSAEGVKADRTTIKVIAEMLDEQDTNAGKVGLAVGELNGKLYLPYFTATWNVDVNNDWKYDKCRYFINQNTMVFKGCKNGNNVRYYVGYSPDAQEFKLQDIEMVNGYDGQTYNEKGTFNIFEKLNNK